MSFGQSFKISSVNNELQHLISTLKYGNATPLNVNNGTLVLDPVNRNVGINKINPIYPLDVSGSAKFSNIVDISNTTGTSGQVLVSTGNGIVWGESESSSQIDISSSNIDQNFYITFVPDISGTNNMFVDNNALVFNPNLNKLGVGTSSPSYNLDISGDTYMSGQIVASNGIGANGQVLTLNAFGQMIWDDISGTGGGTADAVKTFDVSNNINYYLTFVKDTSGANTLYVDSQSFVINPGYNRIGLNNLNPTFNIDVSTNDISGMRIGRALYVDASNNIVTVSGKLQSTELLDSTNSSGNSNLYLKSTPSGLQWSSLGVTSSQWTSDSSGNIYFPNSLTDLSNVGIGVINPTYKLDVSGETNIRTTNVRIGRNAGEISQNFQSIAIGSQSGFNNQGCNSIAFGRWAGRVNQGENSIAIGSNTAVTDQSSNSIAIGTSTATIRQQTNSIAIGAGAGYADQNGYSIAIGSSAGRDSQGFSSIAIGCNAAQSNQDVASISIGSTSGQYFQQFNSVAIGTNAGQYFQLFNSIAIGESAGQNSQNNSCVAIGTFSGNLSQGFNSIAIGENSAFSNQLERAIAIGTGAGLNNQNSNTIAIGSVAGSFNQGESSIAIGNNAGRSSQQSQSIAIGSNAGFSMQGSNSVAIGSSAGEVSQGTFSVAIGGTAGNNLQSSNSVAIGFAAGGERQQSGAIAVGFFAGTNSQQTRAIAIGDNAGYIGQKQNSIAIGRLSGQNTQGNSCVAIGDNAGNILQGDRSVAIGFYAGNVSQASNSIILNASGIDASLNASNSGFYVSPLRSSTNTSYPLVYDLSSKEIAYNNTANVETFSVSINTVTASTDVSLGLSYYFPFPTSGAGAAGPIESLSVMNSSTSYSPLQYSFIAPINCILKGGYGYFQVGSSDTVSPSDISATFSISRISSDISLSSFTPSLITDVSSGNFITEGASTTTSSRASRFIFPSSSSTVINAGDLIFLTGTISGSTATKVNYPTINGTLLFKKA